MKDKSNSFSYRGIVTVKNQRNGHIISTSHYHNNGLLRFFRALCSIVAGGSDSNRARAEVTPKYIALYCFSNRVPTEVDLLNNSWESLTNGDLLSNATELLPIDFIVAENAGLEDTTTNKPTIQISSKIPYSVITSDFVHIVALFPGTVDLVDKNNIPKKALAWYKFVNEADMTWEPVTIDRTAYDGSILIEWQMDFSNVEEV